MSTDTRKSYQSRSTGRGRSHGEPWKPVEILAMVLGFIVNWPIGLAVLGWKSGRRNPVTPATSFPPGEKNGDWANWARGSDRWGSAVKPPPVLAWARLEIAPSTNGAPLQLARLERTPKPSPPSANLRN